MAYADDVAYVIEQLDLGKVVASYRHGVLTLRVPRREETKPREIKVRMGKA